MTQSILSESASIQLAEGILKLADKIAEEKLRMMQKKWLMQKEVLKEYSIGVGTLSNWEALGLKHRKQGGKRYYDRDDIEELLDSMKE